MSGPWLSFLPIVAGRDPVNVDTHHKSGQTGRKVLTDATKPFDYQYRLFFGSPSFCEPDDLPGWYY
jgi:hypothetical protein